MKALFAIIFTFISIGLCASTLDVKSNPDAAEIHIISGSGKSAKLGVTPYKGDLNEIIGTYVKANSFVVELRKPGHDTYRVLFTKTADVDVELSVNLEVSKAVSTVKEHDMLMIELFEVQKLIRGKNFRDALLKLDELEKKHTHFSIIAELKAISYYMQKDIENSLSYYRKAFAINPDNTDAYRMKVYLEKKLGVDSETK